MHPLVESLYQLVIALGDLGMALGALVLPFLPLVVWVVFWIFGVNWLKLRVVLLEGGWVGIVLLGLFAVLVWGTVAPPPSGFHHFLGLTVSNFVGKTVLVTTLICIMFLCGAVQLSGACGSLCHFEEPEPETTGHDAHAHPPATESGSHSPAAAGHH
jgi:hypothetical protein